MEIAILGVIIAGLAGALFYDWYTQQGHVQQVLARWQAANKHVDVPPAGVICHGDRPSTGSAPRLFGALGMANGDLVFLGQRESTYDLSATSDTIRWIGVRTETTHSWNRSTEHQTLILHLEMPTGWHVYTFSQGKPGRLMGQLADQIAAQIGLPVHDMGEIYEDYGPVAAIRLTKSEAGEWEVDGDASFDLDHVPSDWDGRTNSLYLAPDRLLFGWTDAIRLAAIRQVTVEPRKSAHTLTASDYDLLRVEVAESPGQAARSIGFLLEGGQDWVNEIEAQRAELAAG